MRIEKHHPYSHHLGGTMPVAVYGHWGVPLLFFPTASADYQELERFGMIEALAPHIEAGRIKVYSVNSINATSWLDQRVGPGERAWRQELYDRYVVQELVPFIYWHCQGRLPLATAGASFGAYHAANTLFRHPTMFRWCICMSGIYDVSRYFDGYFDDRCYFHNPMCYLPNLNDPYLRGALDQCSINVVCGQGAWERVHWSQQLHEVLSRVGIRHNFDLWGHDVSHDWPWWKIEMDHYVQKLFA